MEQPGVTMRVLRLIMGVYHEYLVEVNQIPGG